MTLNRMGKTSRAGIRNLGSRRAWIAGALAVGVVATSGAVASATLQGPPSKTKTEVSAEDCLNLDEKTMKALFEAWKKQGIGSGAPTTGETPDETTGETTESPAPKAANRDARPRASHPGRKTASVPLSELSISACEGDTSTTPTDTGTTPTDTGTGTGTEPNDTGTTPTVTSTAS